jgi:hypothetical protein
MRESLHILRRRSPCGSRGGGYLPQLYTFVKPKWFGEGVERPGSAPGVGQYEVVGGVKIGREFGAN